MGLFLKEKPDFKNVMMGLIKYLTTKSDIQVCHLHCDNARGNVDFKCACKQEGIGMEFEYTPPGTTKQNGQIKGKFATLINWVCVMFNCKKVSSFLRNGLWVKAAKL